MPRAPKDNLPENPAALVAGLALPPESLPDGTKNPEYYRTLYRHIVEMGVASAKEGKSIPQLRQLLDGFSKICDQSGVNEKRILDQRSDAQIISDAVDRLLTDPENALLEEADDTLKRMRSEMEKAINGVDAWYTERAYEAKEANLQPFDPAAMAEWRKKKHAEDDEKRKRIRTAAVEWIDRIDRAMLLREWARDPVPQSAKPLWRDDCLPFPPHKPRFRHIMEASHPLRFMLYVGRSNISEGGRGNQVYQIARHHCRFAFVLWMARTGSFFHSEGVQEGAYCGSHRIEGVIFVSHPRTGKSEFVTHATALDICLNNYLQVLVGHAKSDRASRMAQYTSAVFRDEEPVGRRRKALFPNIVMSDRDDTNSTFRLALDQTIKEPTLTSRGMYEAFSGTNADRVVLDDPVDEKERDSEASRKKTYERIFNTWFTRCQSDESFKIVVATIWHEDDAVARMIRMADRDTDDRLKMAVCIMGAGGPDENFKAVWPEKWDASFLRSQYAANPGSYMTIWGCKPESKSGSIVSRVALYDCESDEHLKFLATAEKYVSVDPTATNREDSDRAGIVFAASGELRWNEKAESGHDIQKSAKRLRIMSAELLKSNQTELVEHIGAACLQQEVDAVMVETVTGFHATAEMLEEKFGIFCIRFDPTGKGKKEIRLRRVAAMLDNSRRSSGAVPVVEFPAQMTESGVLKPIPGIEWLIEEVVKFGVARTDHGLDALTQLCHHLMPDLGVGQGAVSEAIKAHFEKKGDPRILKVLQEIQDKNKPKDVAQEDYDFFCERERRVGREEFAWN